MKMFYQAAVCLLLAAAAVCDAACPGVPSALAFARWDANTCSGTAAGANCTGQCARGYTSLAPVTARCDGSTWAVPSGRCFKQHRGVDRHQEELLQPERQAGTCLGLPQVMITNSLPAYPANCSGTVLGGYCTGQCNKPIVGTTLGYGPSPPTVQCVPNVASATGAAWSTTVTGLCQKSCLAVPNFLPGANWTSCIYTRAIGIRCTGSCVSGYSGTPSLVCGNSGWDLTSLWGNCVPGSVSYCAGLPSGTGTIITNSKPAYPGSCSGTVVGGNCTGFCNDGFGPSPPVVQCVANASSPTGGSWAATATGMCQKVCGAVPSSIEPNANWTACTNYPALGGRCTGSCLPGYSGAPSLVCGTNTIWDPASLWGGCVAGTFPYCAGLPAGQGVWITNSLPGYPGSCSGTAVGGNCTGLCNAGFGPSPPVVQCVANASSPTGGSWAATATGSCKRVCQGAPPAYLLGGVGSWPASCAGGTVVDTNCNATCPNGFASIMCGGDGQWVTSSFFGRCSNNPACKGMPNVQPANLDSWPSNCASADAATVCYGTCRADAVADDKPASICVNPMNGSDPYWSTPVPSACRVGTTAPLKRVFLASSTEKQVIICDFDGGKTFTSCTVNNGVGTISSAPAFAGTPIGVEVNGNKVWITEESPAQSRVCTWYGRQLIDCTNPTARDATIAGQNVLTDDKKTAFVALTSENEIATCNNTDTMTVCSSVEVNGGLEPIGLDVAYNNLWIGHAGGATRCSLTLQGDEWAFNNETDCTTYSIPAGNGNGVLVYGDLFYMGHTDNNTIFVCNITNALALTACREESGGGVFATAFANGPGYAGMAVWPDSPARFFAPYDYSDRVTFIAASTNLQLTVGDFEGNIEVIGWTPSPTTETTGASNLQFHSAPTVPWLP